MSLLLNQHSKLCFRKPVLVRSSPHLSNGLSSLSLQTDSQTRVLLCADPCGGNRGIAMTMRSSRFLRTLSFEGWEEMSENEDKICAELLKEMGAIGSCGGWLPTLKDGVLRLREVNLNHETDRKRIPLPPLVTLPHCQTKVVTNVAMSSSSPEDEDCVVALKFLGPQLSLCRPAQRNSEWTNIRIENPCFYSSPVMFSKKDGTFRILGSGGHLIGSWDLHKHKNKPKIQRLRFKNLPELTKTKRELLHSCCTSQHLVESTTTNETFLVKWYRKDTSNGVVKMKTRAVMVFKLYEEGKAVYTQDIGDLCIFLSKSEPFCVTASSFPGMCPNEVHTLDVDEHALVDLSDSSIISGICTFGSPYYFPPPKIDS